MFNKLRCDIIDTFKIIEITNPFIKRLFLLMIIIFTFTYKMKK